jgi:AcrR family transcriptional regulator
MEAILSKIRLQVSEALYLKDPESSELGINIIHYGIELIDELGFEDFTFRKLGQKIGSNEASVYRYFESKNKLLMYLSSWYWAWMEYRLVLSLTNIQSPEKRLEKAVMLIAEDLQEDDVSGNFNVFLLSRIVNFESSKSFLCKSVDKENKDGAFQAYKQFVARVSRIVTEIAPKYKYPNMLITSVIEGIHLQKFFAGHLPGLTNKQKNPDYIYKFYMDMVLKTIKH